MADLRLMCRHKGDEQLTRFQSEPQPFDTLYDVECKFCHEKLVFIGMKNMAEDRYEWIVESFRQLIDRNKGCPCCLELEPYTVSV
jgi:hypothetical protein